MKKTKLLIPSLLVAAIAPTISLVGCGSSIYEANHEERLKAVSLEGVEYVQITGIVTSFEEILEYAPGCFHVIEKSKTPGSNSYSETFVLKLSAYQTSIYLKYYRNDPEAAWGTPTFVDEERLEKPKDWAEDMTLEWYLLPLSLGFEYTYDQKEKCYTVQFQYNQETVTESFYFKNKKLIAATSSKNDEIINLTYEEKMPPLPQ